MLIGVNEQCDLYPNILALLADESGTRVITALTPDAIVPASSTRKNIIFNILFISSSPLRYFGASP